MAIKYEVAVLLLGLLLLASLYGEEMVAYGDGEEGPRSNNIGLGGGCNMGDLVLEQNPSSPMPNGIPTYTVQILNTCVSGCSTVSDIHVSCGWFSTARMVNPEVFRRVSYDDCLVNNGAPIYPGQSVSFEYADTRPYPLSIVSINCS